MNRKLIIGLMIIAGVAYGNSYARRMIESNILTVTHDGHTLIVYSTQRGAAMIHHPDCPCGKGGD